MNLITDVTLDTSGADPVLTVTKHNRATESGVLVEATQATSSSITILAPYYVGSGDPPTDGSIKHQLYRDKVGHRQFINDAWPVTATPDWQEI